MAIWQSNDVQANGIQQHITRTGGDKPPLLPVHGVSDDGLCWSPVAVDLSADYDVIMILNLQMAVVRTFLFDVLATPQ